MIKERTWSQRRKFQMIKADKTSWNKIMGTIKVANFTEMLHIMLFNSCRMDIGCAIFQ